VTTFRAEIELPSQGLPFVRHTRRGCCC
jgi:hypothetical protein